MKRWARVAGAIVGLALLIGALALVWSQRDSLSTALQAIERPDPAQVVLLIVSVAASVVCTSMTFTLLMVRFGRVGVVEMQGLILASALLNYLPLRPGLLGRVAYHKAVHDIRARDSTLVVMQALGLTLVVAGIAMAIIVLCSSVALRPAVVAGLVVVAMGVLGGVHRGLRTWVWALGFRFVDLMLGGLRYKIAFGLLGQSIGYDIALGLAAVGMAAAIVPFFSNGMGVREWAIGLMTGVLAGFPQALELGIVADLVIRVAELIVVVPGGLLAIALLARARRRAQSSAEIPSEERVKSDMNA